MSRIYGLDKARPFAVGPGGALLLEVSSSTPRISTEDLLGSLLSDFEEMGQLTDGRIAQNEAQRAEIFMMRDYIAL